jgi:hypothetical protein
MPWSSRPAKRAAPAVIACLAVLFALILAVSGFADERRLSIYSGAMSYSLAVREKNGLDYVGLLEILQPLGPVSARTDGQVWRLNYAARIANSFPGKLARGCRDKP